MVYEALWLSRARLGNASHHVDDKLLGILGPGRRDLDYIARVAEAISQLSGEARRAAALKFIAVCAIVDAEPFRRMGESEMWLEETKDSAIAKRFVEIAGRDRLAEQERRGIVKSFVAFAEERNANTDLELVDELVLYGNEASLMSLMREADDLPVGGNVREFVRGHGIDLPDHTL